MVPVRDRAAEQERRCAVSKATKTQTGAEMIAVERARPGTHTESCPWKLADVGVDLTPLARIAAAADAYERACEAVKRASRRGRDESLNDAADRQHAAMRAAREAEESLLAAVRAWRGETGTMNEDEKMVIGKCARCGGRLCAVVASDGSCWEADRCESCGASWWHNPPSSIELLRTRAIAAVRIVKAHDETAPGMLAELDRLRAIEAVAIAYRDARDARAAHPFRDQDAIELGRALTRAEAALFAALATVPR